MIRILHLTLIVLVLSGACFAQDAGLPAPEIRSGVVPTPTVPAPKPPPTSIENRYELRELGVFPAEYRYSLEGQTVDRRFVVSRITLAAPDGSRHLTLERFAGTFDVALDGPKLRVDMGSPHTLVPSPRIGLQQCLRKDVAKRGAGRYELKGWSVEILEADGSARRLAVVDAIKAKPILGKRRWAVEVRPTGYKVGIKSHTILATSSSIHTGVASGLVRLVREDPTPSAGLAGSLPQ